jgi:hypothetical protein
MRHLRQKLTGMAGSSRAVTRIAPAQGGGPVNGIRHPEPPKEQASLDLV